MNILRSIATQTLMGITIPAKRERDAIPGFEVSKWKAYPRREVERELSRRHNKRMKREARHGRSKELLGDAPAPLPSGRRT